MVSPSTNGMRKVNGQFAAGNKYGRGNPHAQKVAQLRTALIQAVTPQDMEEIMKALISQCKAGDIASIKLLLPYLVGSIPQPVNPDEIEIQQMYLESKFMDTAAMIERKKRNWTEI